MKENRGAPVPPEPARLVPPDDELTARITSALHSRDALRPEPAFVVARIEAELARRSEETGRPVPLRRGGRIVAAGLATGALAVGGAGAAAAANPYSDVARVMESAVQALGIDWSVMPDGYSRDEYAAFWHAGYTTEDVEALAALWQTDFIEAKATAGQLILEGKPVPVAPGSTLVPPGEGGTDWSTLPEGYTQAQYEAFWGAGYTPEDIAALAELWNTDLTQAKATAGQMLLDGQTPPIAPGSTVSGS